MLNSPSPAVTDYQGNTTSTTVNTGPVQGATTGGGGGGAATPAIDPAINAYYDNMTNNVNSQLGLLPGQQAIDNQNILDAYNTSYNTMAGQKAIADRNYNQTKGTDLSNNVDARGQVAYNVGQGTNALQQLLGSRGAGDSSAAFVAAPYAEARLGSLQDQGIQKAYDQNQQALDTNYGDYTNQYNTSLDNLGHQRDLQQKALQASIDQNKTGLLSQLANISSARAQAQPGATYQSIQAAAQPYQDQINTLSGQITQLGQNYAHPVVQAPQAAYKAPSLSSYNVAPQASPTFNQAPGAASNISPFLDVLMNGQQQQKNMNNIPQGA
jgi:hypothetical protein